MEVEKDTVLWGAGVLGGVFSVLFRLFFGQFYKRLDNLEECMKEAAQALSAHRENSAEKYVTRSEMKEAISQISAGLIRIEQKIDVKLERLK